jgi:iron complex transport system substrate-binding protein
MILSFKYDAGLMLGCGLALLCLLTACSRSSQPAPASSGSRVVSLAPSLTEIIFAIGAESRLVGRTDVCNYPPDKLKSVPIVGGFGAPSLDLLIQLQPTLVLEVDLADSALGTAIDQAGLNRQRIACSTLDNIPRAIMTVGRLTQSEAAARALAEPMSRRIAVLRQAAEARKASGLPIPSVFVEIWGEPLTTCGKESVVSDLVTLAGGHNLGDEASDKPYFAVSTEWVIARNPDVIICLDMSSESKPAVRDQKSAAGENGAVVSGKISNPQLNTALDRVAGRTGWAGIAAVKNGRVYGDLDDNVILRPGPRVLEGIEALRKRIEQVH